jgi:hypothetical protein
MKQLIVMAAAIMLGAFIFGLVAGPQEGSVRSVLRGVWQQEVDMRTMNEAGAP